MVNLAQYKKQVMNALLRLIPMTLKLFLTLYMGKYFELTDIGIYGLVFGVVTILGIILGQNFAYIVIRDIVGVEPITALHKMRDQTLLFLSNYLLLAFIVLFLVHFQVTKLEPHILYYIAALSILEHLGAATYFSMNSLNQQMQANAMFFIRSGLWVVPVVALCILYPELRRTETVLAGWTIGSLASIIMTVWCWRDMPWRKVNKLAIDWPWLVKGLKKSSLIWVGMVGLTAGGYVDRFVVEHYLTMDDVGTLTFYFSFTNALLTLMQSGVMAFATPRLIKNYRDGDTTAFTDEVRSARRQVALGAALVALGLAVFVPAFGYFFHRPAFVEADTTFWLLLVGTWLRANADMLYFVLFARHEDRAIWLGNLMFLLPALGGNLLFVPAFGFIGIGYSSVAAGLFLLLWRICYVRRPVLSHQPMNVSSLP